MISWQEYISDPANINQTFLDRYDDFWALQGGPAVNPALTSTDNRMAMLKALTSPTSGTLVDAERLFFGFFGPNAPQYTIADLRAYAANGGAPPIPPTKPLFP